MQKARLEIRSLKSTNASLSGELAVLKQHLVSSEDASKGLQEELCEKRKEALSCQRKMARLQVRNCIS